MNYKVKNIYGRTTDEKIVVSVHGSKSITARALLLSALADGESVLYGAHTQGDCRTFINCLKALGIKCCEYGTTIRVEGCGGKLPVSYAEIDVGSAGTAARFLTALLAFNNGEFRVNSSAQMKARPIEPLVSALKSIGAEFIFEEKENCFPFVIRGTGKIKPEISVDVTKSSQFLSGLLMSAVCAGKPFVIRTSGNHAVQYVNMTLNMMWSFGVNVEEHEGEYTVCGKYSAKKYDIEPDVSSACYFYAMNKILGTQIDVNGIMPHSMQGDIGFINLLKNFNGGRVNMGGFSDQALTLAAIAPYLSQPTEITNVAHIREQECNRIEAIKQNLSAMGVRCEELPDGVRIYPSVPKPAKINTFGDHRVAMSFALTGLRADGIVIERAEVCEKTFKNFFNVFDEICEKLLK